MHGDGNGYRIIRPLGAGGMGSVFEVELTDGTRRALKRFSADHGNVAFLKERFVIEGRVLERLSHPRLVRVQDVGIDADGHPYFMMDLILDAAGESVTLESVRSSGRISEADAERFFADLVDALRYCHAQGVVHRDVKLDNVLIDGEGHAVLSDFGISRIVNADMRDELRISTTFVTGETTGTRPVMGTYWYLAPELRKGGTATSASDWYALGVTFFRLLTGLWYEPGTEALELLAPYDKVWTTRLKRLLADDPSERHPTRDCSRRNRFRLMVRVILPTVLSSGILAVLIGAIIPISSPSPLSSSPPPPFTSTSHILQYGEDADFAFRPCPPGTNAYERSCVTVTEPYFLAETPVTRRQWFAVRGEPLAAWTGGEDAPMTSVTREEVDDFCARLNGRFADRLPKGYEIRLPTVAEWRLAYAQGNTMTNVFERAEDLRRAYDRIGWFGQGLDGASKSASMRRYYTAADLPMPWVKDIWPDFPPKVLSPGTNEWMRYSSQVAPVPVGLKPANGLGLHDLCGNCFERAYDTGLAEMSGWGFTEWGQTANGLYAGQGLSVTNPVERSGTSVLMLGAYFAPDLSGDRVWKSPYDPTPFLGFRLCLGPKIANP